MTSNFYLNGQYNSYFNPINAVTGKDYYKSIYSGVNKELYWDSIANGNLYRYNLQVQNYYIDKPVMRIKKVSFIPSQKVKKSFLK